MKIEVIMPFFQRRKGLLARAVDSCTCAYGLDVIINIIDDESPIEANTELIKAFGSIPTNVKLIRQKNSGVAVARNKALATLDDDTEYVCFLDPDDSWNPAHIKNIKKAIDYNSDFYFCDLYAYSNQESHFEWAGVQRKQLRRIDDNFFEYTDNLLEAAVVGRLPILTSTVAIKRSLIDSIRFNTEFKQSSEDHWYWLNIITKSSIITLSTNRDEINFNNEGVDLHSSIKKDFNKQLQSIIDQILLHSKLNSLINNNKSLTKKNIETIKQLQQSFFRVVVWFILENKSFSGEKIKEYKIVNKENWVYVKILLQLIRMLRSKLLQKLML